MAADSKVIEAEIAIQRVANELLHTERTYLDNLNKLRKEFIEPMQNSKLVSEDRINDYFLEVYIINGLHSLLVENLQREMDCWPSSKIPQLFLQFVPTFRVYTHYVLRFSWISDEMKKLAKRKPKLKTILPGRRYWPQRIENHLITPVQRIPRYKLLLAEIIKCRQKIPNAGRKRKRLAQKSSRRILSARGAGSKHFSVTNGNNNNNNGKAPVSPPAITLTDEALHKHDTLHNDGNNNNNDLPPTFTPRILITPSAQDNDFPKTFSMDDLNNDTTTDNMNTNNNENVVKRRGVSFAGKDEIGASGSAFFNTNKENMKKDESRGNILTIAATRNGTGNVSAMSAISDDFTNEISIDVDDDYDYNPSSPTNKTDKTDKTNKTNYTENTYKTQTSDALTMAQSSMYNHSNGVDDPNNNNNLSIDPKQNLIQLESLNDEYEEYNIEMKFAVEFDVSHEKQKITKQKSAMQVVNVNGKHVTVNSIGTQMRMAVEDGNFDLLDALRVGNDNKKNNIDDRNSNASGMKMGDRLSVVSNDQHGMNRPINFRRHSDWYYTHSDHKENTNLSEAFPYADIKVFVAQTFEIDVARVSFVEIEEKSYGYNFEFDILLTDMLSCGALRSKFDEIRKNMLFQNGFRKVLSLSHVPRIRFHDIDFRMINLDELDANNIVMELDEDDIDDEIVLMTDDSNATLTDFENENEIDKEDGNDSDKTDEDFHEMEKMERLDRLAKMAAAHAQHDSLASAEAKDIAMMAVTQEEQAHLQKARKSEELLPTIDESVTKSSLSGGKEKFGNQMPKRNAALKTQDSMEQHNAQLQQSSLKSHKEKPTFKQTQLSKQYKIALAKIDSTDNEADNDNDDESPQTQHNTLSTPHENKGNKLFGGRFDISKESPSRKSRKGRSSRAIPRSPSRKSQLSVRRMSSHSYSHLTLGSVDQDELEIWSDDDDIDELDDSDDGNGGKHGSGSNSIGNESEAAMAEFYDNEYDQEALKQKNEKWKRLRSRKRLSIANHPLGIMKRVSEATSLIRMNSLSITSSNAQVVVSASMTNVVVTDGTRLSKVSNASGGAVARTSSLVNLHSSKRHSNGEVIQRSSTASSAAGMVVHIAPILLRHASSALSLAPNGASNHNPQNTTNKVPLSPMAALTGTLAYEQDNNNANNSNNNNSSSNNRRDSNAHRRNSSINSLGNHQYTTSNGSLSFGTPSSAVIQTGISHRQSQRLSQLALAQTHSSRMVPLIMMPEDDDAGYMGGYYSSGFMGGTPKTGGGMGDYSSNEPILKRPKTASHATHGTTNHHKPRTKHELKRQRSQHRRMQKKLMQVGGMAPFSTNNLLGDENVNNGNNGNNGNVNLSSIEFHGPSSSTQLGHAFSSEQASPRHKNNVGSNSNINNSKVLGNRRRTSSNLSNNSGQIGFRNSFIQAANSLSLDGTTPKSGKRTSFIDNNPIIPALPTARRLVSGDVGQSRPSMQMQGFILVEGDNEENESSHHDSNANSKENTPRNRSESGDSIDQLHQKTLSSKLIDATPVLGTISSHSDDANSNHDSVRESTPQKGKTQIGTSASHIVETPKHSKQNESGKQRSSMNIESRKRGSSYLKNNLPPVLSRVVSGGSQEAFESDGGIFLKKENHHQKTNSRFKRNKSVGPNSNNSKNSHHNHHNQHHRKKNANLVATVDNESDEIATDQGYDNENEHENDTDYVPSSRPGFSGRGRTQLKKNMTDTENDIDASELNSGIFKQPPTMPSKSSALVSQRRIKQRKSNMYGTGGRSSNRGRVSKRRSVLPNIGINRRSMGVGTPRMGHRNSNMTFNDNNSGMNKQGSVRNLHASAAPGPDTPMITEGKIVRESTLGSDLGSPKTGSVTGGHRSSKRISKHGSYRDSKASQRTHTSNNEGAEAGAGGGNRPSNRHRRMSSTDSAGSDESSITAWVRKPSAWQGEDDEEPAFWENERALYSSLMSIQVIADYLNEYKANSECRAKFVKMVKYFTRFTRYHQRYPKWNVKKYTEKAKLVLNEHEYNWHCYEFWLDHRKYHFELIKKKHKKKSPNSGNEASPREHSHVANNSGMMLKPVGGQMLPIGHHASHSALSWNLQTLVSPGHSHQGSFIFEDIPYEDEANELSISLAARNKLAKNQNSNNTQFAFQNNANGRLGAGPMALSNTNSQMGNSGDNNDYDEPSRTMTAAYETTIETAFGNNGNNLTEMSLTTHQMSLHSQQNPRMSMSISHYDITLISSPNMFDMHSPMSFIANTPAGGIAGITAAYNSRAIAFDKHGVPRLKRFALETSSIHKQGWCFTKKYNTKQSKRKKETQWKSRYFVLKGKILCRYHVDDINDGMNNNKKNKNKKSKNIAKQMILSEAHCKAFDLHSSKIASNETVIQYRGSSYYSISISFLSHFENLDDNDNDFKKENESFHNQHPPLVLAWNSKRERDEWCDSLKRCVNSLKPTFLFNSYRQLLYEGPANCQYDQFFGKGVKIPVKLFLANDILIICDKRPLIEYNEQQAKQKQNDKNNKNENNSTKPAPTINNKKDDKSKKKKGPRESRFISKLFSKRSVDPNDKALAKINESKDDIPNGMTESEFHTGGLPDEDEEALKREYADFYKMSYFGCIHLMEIQNLQFIDNTDDCILIQNFYETFIFSFDSESERNSWYDRLTHVRANLQLLIQRIPSSEYAEINVKKVDERITKLENQESQYREKIRSKLNELFSMEDAKIAKLKKQEKAMEKIGLISKQHSSFSSKTATNTTTQANALLADDEDDEIKLREIQEEFLHMIEEYSNFQLKLYHIRARKDELLLYLNNQVFIEGFDNLPTEKQIQDLDIMDMTPAARAILMGVGSNSPPAIENTQNGMGNASNLTVENSMYTGKDTSIDRSHTPPTVSHTYDNSNVAAETTHTMHGTNTTMNSNGRHISEQSRTLRGTSRHNGHESNEELSHTNTLQGTLTWRMKSTKDTTELPKGINKEKWNKTQQKFLKKEAKMFANDIKSVEVDDQVS